jgi:hypothetical protein
VTRAACRHARLDVERPSEDLDVVSRGRQIDFVPSQVEARAASLQSRRYAGQLLMRRSRWLHPFHRGDQILMSARIDHRSRALFLAVRTTLFDQYGLDMGVPFRLRALAIVFPDQRWQSGRGREMLARAASLAGLIIGPAGAPEHVEKFIALEETARGRRLRTADLTDWLKAH